MDETNNLSLPIVDRGQFMNRSLLELQLVDDRLARIKRERGKLDDGTTLRTQCDKLRQAVQKAAETLDQLTKQHRDREFELKTLEEKIAKQQSRLMNAKSAHEVTSLQRDIGALGRTRSELDETILLLMDEVESATAEKARLENELESKEEETRVAEENFKQDRDSFRDSWNEQKDNFYNNSIFSIQEINDSILWLGTDNGLNIFHRNSGKLSKRVGLATGPWLPCLIYAQISLLY